MPYVERTHNKPSDPRSLEAYALAYKEQLQAQHYATQSVQYKYASLLWFIDWCHERGSALASCVALPPASMQSCAAYWQGYHVCRFCRSKNR